jgi:hypothetical protein
MRFEIERIDDTRLSRRVWAFEIGNHARSATPVEIILVRYVKENRKTTRHKWKRDESQPIYSSDTSDDWRYGKYMSREVVPLPADVRDEAIKYVVESLRVVIPSGRFELAEENNKRYAYYYNTR